MQPHGNDGPLCSDADTMEKAQNGDSFAQLDIGKAYYSTYQMEGNCSLAFKWISLSAQQGNMESQFRLGDLYALGQGTEKCHTHAYEWYTKSALQGYSKALIRIHNLYEDDKFMHCRGHQSDEEQFRWPLHYVKRIVGARSLSEYRLQQSISIQNQAMEFYRQRFNDFSQKKELVNADSQLQLGFMYQHGYGTKKNINRAIECYTNASKEEIAEAQYNLGEIYLNKKQSTKHDTQEAFEWFFKSAENGNTMAQCCLAHLYEEGIGVEKDYAKSLHWYSLAAEMRSTSAQLGIARIYRIGQGIRQDYSKAIEWYNRAAKGGNRAAQNCLDQLYAQAEWNPDRNSMSKQEYYRNPTNGRRMNSLLRQHISEIHDINKVKQLQKLALNIMRRDINAMYEIGKKYQDGADLPQDSDLSVKWIKKAARGGLDKAQFTMGEMYEEGELIEQDYHRASIWYKKKPHRHNDIFQYRLGNMYICGRGVRLDHLEASKWFFKSADKGNSDSQCCVGRMRRFGLSMREDKHEAFEWFKKSARQRNGNAMHVLGDMYLKGEITENDSSTALLWYRHSLNHGGEHVSHSLIENSDYSKNELKDLKTTNFFLEDPNNTRYDGLSYYSMAKCYLKGYMVEQDYFNAYKFIKKSLTLNSWRGESWLSIPARPGGDIDGNDLMNMYTLVCEKGVDNLQYNIGYVYEYGLRGDISNTNPIKKNISKAVDWYMTASKKGDSRADYRLGVIYEDGKDVQRDMSIAINFYRKALEQNNENAMYRLANLYLRGEGVTQDFEKAYQLFTNAHNMGQHYSHLFLKISGEFLSTNYTKNTRSIEASTEEDDENELVFYSYEKESNVLSLEMLEAVGLSGNVAVQYQLGCLYGDSKSDNKDYSKAAYWFGLASQGGITSAYYRLGRLYEEGQGVEKSYPRSLLFYQKAAAKDHDKALYRLARIYQYGLGTQVDFSKAFELYKQSAEQGNDMATMFVTLLKGLSNDLLQSSISERDGILLMYENVASMGDTSIQFELGYYYEVYQLEPEYTKAAKWYSMATNVGHIHATHRLGRLYELGLGITQNYGYAFELYTIAKEGGLSEATLRLGNMYQNGLGVNIDYKRAFDYYMRASGQGNNEAQSKLGQIYDQGIYKSKNPLMALKWYTRAYLRGNDNVRESLYILYDGEQPYENIFYGRLAKILLGYAKNEEYHLKQRTNYDGDIYARLCHVYLHGQGVQKDCDLSWHYLSVAINMESDASRLILSDSIIHVIKDNISEVYNMALKRSETGDKSAHIVLGILYLGGAILLEESKECDKKIYSTLFEDIFDLNDNSLYNEYLSIGTAIIPKDYKKALKHFIEAADTTNLLVKVIVGQMYHCGYGTKQNLNKALQCYEGILAPASFKRNVRKYLGLLYSYGEGVDCNIDLGIRYLQLYASTRGDFFSTAQVYYFGDATIRNNKTALKYLLMATTTKYEEGLFN